MLKTPVLGGRSRALGPDMNPHVMNRLRKSYVSSHRPNRHYRTGFLSIADESDTTGPLQPKASTSQSLGRGFNPHRPYERGLMRSWSQLEARDQWHLLGSVSGPSEEDSVTPEVGPEGRSPSESRRRASATTIRRELAVGRHRVGRPWPRDNLLTETPLL